MASSHSMCGGAELACTPCLSDSLIARSSCRCPHTAEAEARTMIVSSIVDSYILYVVSESATRGTSRVTPTLRAIQRPRSRRRLAMHDTRLPPCNNICDVGKDGAATFWRLEGWPWYCSLVAVWPVGCSVEKRGTHEEILSRGGGVMREYVRGSDGVAINSKEYVLDLSRWITQKTTWLSRWCAQIRHSGYWGGSARTTLYLTFPPASCWNQQGRKHRLA
jgi:hypothetical protein